MNEHEENKTVKTNYKIRAVKTIKLTGTPSRKLGCFNDPLILQSFILDMMDDITDEQYIKHFAKFASSQKEMDDFKGKLASCELEFH